jgi:hypothetical protein
MRTAIVAGGNATPVFDPAEAVFDFMPLFVEYLIVRLRTLAVLFRWNAGLDILFNQRLAEGIARSGLTDWPDTSVRNSS